MIALAGSILKVPVQAQCQKGKNISLVNKSQVGKKSSYKILFSKLVLTIRVIENFIQSDIESID